MGKLRLKKKVKFTIAILVFLGLLLISTSIIYCYIASPVDRNDNKEIEVTIESGMSSRDISKLLEQKGLIRSSDFFILYYRLNKCSSLKASTYNLKKSMSINTIFNYICSGGFNKNTINITFKEGKRITDYAKVVDDNTNNSYDDFISVMQDREYIKTLIDKYSFLTEDILNDNIYYPLEGYLFPDTYNFQNKDVDVKEIVEVMLDQTNTVLEKYNNDINNSNFNIHQLFTLASMTELEGTNTENRKMIAGIFINRLNINMSLGSDVTTYYALQKSMDNDLTVDEFNTTNPYNTRNINNKGLPVGPICSISKSSLESVLYPTASDYYYFVADKNKNIYYTKTSSEHLSLVNELKREGNWIW